MILTRIKLNPMHRLTYQLVGDVEALHKTLCACVGNKRDAAGLLFRVEKGPTLLVQSREKADWSKFSAEPNVLMSEPEDKEFEPQFAKGATYAFRLRCRPSKKVKVEGKRHSSQRFLRTEEERLEWLRRQGEKCGFAVVRVEVTYERWQAPGDEPARSLVVPAVRFDGELVVTDPEKLQYGVRNGIGPQKAYGFGLLSLAPWRG